MLEINDLYVGYYRDLNILQGVTMQAEDGKITTILGANGVGKSTMLKAIYGFLRPNQGQILLNDQDIIDVPTHETHQHGHLLHSPAAGRLPLHVCGREPGTGRVDIQE